MIEPILGRIFKPRAVQSWPVLAIEREGHHSYHRISWRRLYDTIWGRAQGITRQNLTSIPITQLTSPRAESAHQRLRKKKNALQYG